LNNNETNGVRSLQGVGDSSVKIMEILVGGRSTMKPPETENLGRCEDYEYFLEPYNKETSKTISDSAECNVKLRWNTHNTVPI